MENRVLFALLLTGFLSFIYGAAQFFDLDPVNWSSKFVFGTLGNVNFFAAFLALVTVASGSLVMDSDAIKGARRIGLGIFTLLLILLNLKTDSMQGPVTTVVGISVAILILLKKRGFFGKIVNMFSSICLLLATTVLSVMGLFGRGPLGSILYQDSNVFRSDYMLAGIRMTASHPLFGVGLDSYDNWYRTERGFVSAYRTGLNRTSNSAHNIFLDISSGGGLPLLAIYSTLILLVAWKCFSYIRHSSNISGQFVAIFSCWVAYQFQSLLSINQMGVGIWGWLLLGALIAILKREETNSPLEKSAKKISPKSKKTSTPGLPASSAIIGFIGFALGFVLAYIPFSADSNFRRAMDARDVSGMSAALNRPGSSAFLISKALSSAIADQNSELARELADKLTSQFPREIFGWDVKARSSLYDEETRKIAIARIEEIEPNAFCFKVNPENTFMAAFGSLPLSAKAELLSWWGFVPRQGASVAQIESAQSSNSFQERVKSLCR